MLIKNVYWDDEYAKNKMPNLNRIVITKVIENII